MILKLASQRLSELLKEYFLCIPPYIIRNQLPVKEGLTINFTTRLKNYRSVIIPWLEHVRPLQGLKILEIGCGPGASTLSLAEQKAHVTAIDIDKDYIQTARDRCTFFGIQANFMVMNSTEITDTFTSNDFDCVIFFASLEHMNISDRIKSLKAAWDILDTGGFLIIIETPNRLWYYDSHSSWLPFFQWLPDDLAYQYTRFSSREWFKRLLDNDSNTTKEDFILEGRAVSFHEFDIALKPSQNLKVISSLNHYQDNIFRKLYFHNKKKPLDYKYKSILKKIYPQIHDGFYDEFLNLIIEKD